MKHLPVLLLIALLFVPLPAVAGPDDGKEEAPPLVFVDKPQLEKCADDKRCLNVEAYRAYLTMRVQYVWLFRSWGEIQTVVTALEKANEANKERAELGEARAERAEKRNDQLLVKYVDAVREAETAKGYSVFGGGIPWLIVAALLGAAGGAYATYAITK